MCAADVVGKAWACFPGELIKVVGRFEPGTTEALGGKEGRQGKGQEKRVEKRPAGPSIAGHRCHQASGANASPGHVGE